MPRRSSRAGSGGHDPSRTAAPTASTGSSRPGAGIALATEAPTWMVLGDLALAARPRRPRRAAAVSTPLRIVVVDNDGGGIFDFLPQADQVEADRFAALFTTPAALDIEAAAATFGLAVPGESEGESDLAALADADRVLAHVPVGRAGNVGSPIAERGRRRRGGDRLSSAREQRQQRAELDLGLGELGGGIGVGDDPGARRRGGRSRSRSRAERRATQNSPSSTASIQPTGPAYQPRSRRSSSGDQPLSLVGRAAPARPPGSDGGARRARGPSGTRRAGRGSASPGAGCWRP